MPQALHDVLGCPRELCGVDPKHKAAPQLPSRGAEGAAAGLPAATTSPLTF